MKLSLESTAGRRSEEVGLVQLEIDPNVVGGVDLVGGSLAGPVGVCLRSSPVSAVVSVVERLSKVIGFVGRPREGRRRRTRAACSKG